jgi:hypothetical protein
MDGSGTADGVDPLTVVKRLQGEGRWFGEIEDERNDMMREARKVRKLSKVDAQIEVYAELDAKYPRIIPRPPEPEVSPIGDVLVDPPEAGVSGLGDIPSDWPQLPPNGTLQADVSWVIANRLLVRDGDGVDLSRSLAPAPSYAALSWLETSILFPSKFADISVKATSQAADEHEHVQRERLAIADIRSLLAEMVDDA